MQAFFLGFPWFYLVFPWIYLDAGPSSRTCARLAERPQDPRQRFGQVLVDEAGANGPAAGAVQPDSGGSGFERRHRLGRKPRDEAGQHVA